MKKGKSLGMAMLAIVPTLILSFLLADQHKDLTKEINSKAKQIQVLETEKANVEKEKEVLGQEKQRQEEQINGLAEDNNELRGKVNEISEQLIQVQQQLDEKQKQLNDAQKKLEVSKTSTSYNSSSSSNSGQWQDYKATAYSTYENGDSLSSSRWGNLTASGTTVKQGRTIAVDRNRIPLGTKVELQFPPGYEYLNGVYTAEDTGSAIKGNKIDVYMDSIQACNAFGVRQVKLRIIN